MGPAVVLLVGLLGCTSSGSVNLGDATVGDTSTVPADDSGTTPEAPTIVSVSDASCYADGDGLEHWTVTVDATDPQGDIASRGSTVSIMNGETVLASYEMACSNDHCQGTWRATDDGIDCATGRASVFRFVVVDEIGHSSEPYDYTPV